MKSYQSNDMCALLVINYWQYMYVRKLLYYFVMMRLLSH